MLSKAYGLARSFIVYRARPLKRRRARRFYGQFVRPGDLCFDLGAHVGDRVSTFLALGAHVVAVEPQPLFFETLFRFYGRNPHVELRRAAVGSEAGSAEMLISRRTPTMSTLSREWADAISASGSARGVQWDARATVEVMTLDELIAAHGMPAFCKIDVEGYEEAVLEGLSRPIPALSFEYLPGAIDKAERCVRRLSELGPYEFNVSVRETMRLERKSWVKSTEIQHWLSVRRPNDSSGDVYARLQRTPGRLGGP